ncbi:MAG: alkaline phosphatase family protein [Bacteroidetes bacterium]|nr:alkaline phosphatase family protein [Bacteroidota bacterium]
MKQLQTTFQLHLEQSSHKPIITKFLLLVIFCFLIQNDSKAQDLASARNVIVITTDGFRWQELFKGADSSLLNNTEYVKDTLLAKQMYWDSDENIRRQKIMPFFWNVISKQGQIYGNRSYNNKVDLKNFYKISYPGYNEILTGVLDWRPMLNFPIENKNTNVLEYLNNQPDFKGKIAAFTSWNLMPYIFNKQRSDFMINSGYELLNGTDNMSKIIDTVQFNAEESKTRNDQLTYLCAKEYLVKNHPKVLFLGLGETDEYGHQGAYDLYLQKAAGVDKIIADLWYYIQTDQFYKNNTILIITTDHGRGRANKWYTHGFWAKGSGEAWLALLGPDILPQGEMKNKQQIWQKQLAATIASLVGEHFVANHAVADPISLPIYVKSSQPILTASTKSVTK